MMPTSDALKSVNLAFYTDAVVPTRRAMKRDGLMGKTEGHLCAFRIHRQRRRQKEKPGHFLNISRATGN
jgi:hypothetical protein